MKKLFGKIRNGGQAALYTIRGGSLSAEISDLGATVVRLFTPDKNGKMDDIVLGFDNPDSYIASGTFFGSVVGRNANRVKAAKYNLGGKEYQMGQNDGGNNLHSGPDFFKDRIWTVEYHKEDSICLGLISPDGDQSFPGEAKIKVTYTLTAGNELRIEYDAVSDKDTVFNFTNHSYFNLAGHKNTAEAMCQKLTMPARFFNPDDAENIPTGELRNVSGTPMDFSVPKEIGRDIDADYEPLHLQWGYDHNFEVWCNPCAVLSHEGSGRVMEVETDCPGVQLYTGNFIENEQGKDGVVYPKRSGICLETQFYPDSLNHPEWPSPVTRAGERYKSVTVYRFK